MKADLFHVGKRTADIHDEALVPVHSFVQKNLKTKLIYGS